MISFLIAFNYYIVRALKDALLITADHAGAATIPFVKVWLLIPASCLFAVGFAWLSNRFSLRTAFTMIFSFFLFSFALFGFVLFPFREALHPHLLAHQMTEFLPIGWHPLAAVFEYWTYTYFYIMAEHWSPIVYSVLFWGFANEITQLNTARNYYPWLTLAGTVAAIVAGPIAIYLSKDTFNPHFPFGTTAWEQSLYSLTFLILTCGIGTIALFWVICPKKMQMDLGKGKPKLSLWQSLKYLVESPELLLIAVISLSYNTMINFSEVIWKEEALKLYSSPSAFNTYMSSMMLVTGLLSTFITLFITRFALKYWGWARSAAVTPFIALVSGSVFFAILAMKERGVLLLDSGSFLTLSVFLGSCHICLSCSGKYTLFDTTKELAFIPLDSSKKLYGKAAIDGVGSRVGKAGSSLIIQGMLIILPSLSACTPFIGVFLVVSLLFCLRAIFILGNKISQKERESSQQKIAPLNPVQASFR